MTLSQADRKIIRGCLEVVANVDSLRGFGPGFVPKGEVGYVIGSRDGYVVSSRDGHDAVYWPHMKRQYVGDNRSSTHPRSDLSPTGKRG